MRRNDWFIGFLCMLSGLLLAMPVAAQEPPSTDPAATGVSQQPGHVEGVGTHFVITDSDYLNVTLDSTASITLTMESVPQIMTLQLAADPAALATATQLTLSGLAPDTTYHLYTDDLHNHTPFTTDGAGACTLMQDLTVPHMLIIQPRPSTIFLNSTTGWSKPVGTWDAADKQPH